MIINSRGEPTVKVNLTTDLDDRVYSASAPSGASCGEHEAWDLRDHDDHFNGLGVNKALNHVNAIIGPELKGKNILSQSEIDETLVELDGHTNKSRLGANAVLPVSLAVCRAAAAAYEQPLWQYTAFLYRKLNPESKIVIPKPCFNVINGGMHAGNWLDFQEFMVIPQSENYSDNLKAGVELYQELKKVLIDEIGPISINVGDEGGFAPSLVMAESALDLINSANNRLTQATSIRVGIDCAAGTLFKDGHYRLADALKSREAMIDYYEELVNRYPIVFLEDPLEPEDWQGWNQLMNRLGNRIDIIGDDLLATNKERIKEAKKSDAVNGVVIKLNQIGTVTETLQAASLAASFGWHLLVSHRSGDTNDDFISDLAVGIGADYFKSGAPARGERVAKYNRLLEIESELKHYE